MKTILLQRVRMNDKALIGHLTVNNYVVATLEDIRHEVKIPAETAIPAGLYKLKLRNEGTKTKRYAKRFPNMHKGMIWLQDVPGFEWIYIHIGNYPKDTEGCILVGDRARDSSLESSTKAYKRIYPLIVEMIEKEGCQILIHDESDDEGKGNEQ